MLQANRLQSIQIHRGRPTSAWVWLRRFTKQHAALSLCDDWHNASDGPLCQYPVWISMPWKFVDDEDLTNWRNPACCVVGWSIGQIARGSKGWWIHVSRLWWMSEHDPGNHSSPMDHPWTWVLDAANVGTGGIISTATNSCGTSASRGSGEIGAPPSPTHPAFVQFRREQAAQELLQAAQPLLRPDVCDSSESDSSSCVFVDDCLVLEL